MTETPSSSNKRIAKNTLMLYIRMFLIMAVMLYTSRVILKALGVEDFGIYNIVGGIVVFFSFINNAMIASTQRFLNYELGRKDIEEASKVFSASVNIYLAISIIFLLLAESVGLWFLNTYLNIPPERMNAANWVYQFTIITSIINMMKMPYNAAVIAHERMSFYAYSSIIEAGLKLSIVFLIVYFADRLISYAILLSVVSFLILVVYIYYCRRTFLICRHLSFAYNKKRYSDIISFSGWSLFGALANVGTTQGINIILNIFFGVGVNAAMGIASQVNAAIYQFVSNFQTAFNPQIIKSYAAKEFEHFKTLILHTSKYSYYLLFILILPVFICCEEVLEIWLGEVPEHAVSFCRLLLIFSLIDALQGPLWVSAQATGKIKSYQLMVSSLILLNLPIIFFILKLYKIAEIALIVRIFLNIITAFARVVYLNRLYSFPIALFFKKVIIVCIVITAITSAPSYIIYYALTPNWSRLIITISASLMISASIIYFLGLNRNERNFIKTLIFKKNRS